jgi:hypothetical protein
MMPLSQTDLTRTAPAKTTRAGIILCGLLALGPIGPIQQLAAQDQAAPQAKAAEARPAGVQATEANAIGPDPVEKATQDAVEFQKRVENRVVDEFRNAAQSKLLLEVEELSRVCELDAKAVKKLEIAAKGAAERWIRNEEQKLRTYVRLEGYGDDTEVRVAGKKVPRPGEPDEEPAQQPERPENRPVAQPPILQAIGQLFGAAPKPAFQPRIEEPNVANITVAVQRFGLQYRVKHRHGSSSSGFENRRRGDLASSATEVRSRNRSPPPATA